jgi:two-component system phosphate regulon sensor histidine kinase PhoR
MIRLRDYLYFLLSFITLLILVILLDNPLLEGVIVFAIIILTISLLKTMMDKFADQEVFHQQNINYYIDRTKNQANQSAFRLRRLVEALGSGVLLIDENGRIQITNQTLLNTFHFSNVIGESYELLEAYPSLYQNIKKAFLAENHARAQIQIDDFFYDLIMTPIIEKELFQGLLVLVNDITTLKHAEQFQKQFTADVSHELKTPLSALIGMSEILLQNDMEKSSQKDFINTIHEEALRLEIMIKDLLIISKMDRLDYELIKSKVSITKLVKKVVQLMSGPVSKKNLSIEVNLEEAILLIDENKFYQVILNLVKNALAYTDHGTIFIQGEIIQDAYQLKVKDTGMGISKEHQPFVFKRFYRVDEARSRDSGGSGLGLSIIKNVVLKHGGQIHLDSAPLKGSTFTITIPM